MGNLTAELAKRLQDWAHGVGNPTRPTTPLKLALTTTIGTTTDPGTEVTGGSYARQTLTVNSAVAGPVANTGQCVYATMPAADILGGEVWDSAGTPVRLYFGPLLGAAYTVVGSTDVFTSVGHGMIDGTKVAFAPGQAPAGASPNTVYFVVNSAADTFKISATVGGGALNITADGAGTFVKVKPVSAGDTVTVDIGDLDLEMV